MANSPPVEQYRPPYKDQYSYHSNTDTQAQEDDTNSSGTGNLESSIGGAGAPITIGEEAYQRSSPGIEGANTKEQGTVQLETSMQEAKEGMKIQKLQQPKM
uniref:Uncharacterized protein n=1 Tax=Solanum lycopersicum TaxID=4081 RepID=A0A3Q7HBH7_SOLLC